ncbi:hypothetical protein GCM10023195_30940 [Actinoallomurus liliacearum]|uniref:UDP-N-acetylglucosamine kinase n=2 Tax=Actinoallomurus liliacearum TaxID=1080073 RepID=A0ABP8TL80_9ACTN
MAGRLGERVVRPGIPRVVQATARLPRRLTYTQLENPLADAIGDHHPAGMDHAEVLLIGGRAGVGKTTVGWEVSARLRAAGAAHAVIDGDFMGQVHPAPEDDPDRSRITERNLTAVWGNFAALGHRRLVYVNTLCVLPEAAGMFRRAMGADARMIRVLLTASDATAGRRLTGRELGSELRDELTASSRKARLLDAEAPADTVRVATDDRSVMDIAREVVAATGWIGGESAVDGRAAVG